MGIKRRWVIACGMAAAVVVASCGGGNSNETTTTVKKTTTTTEPKGPVAPLTGLPNDDEALLTRPAVAVKIDNHPSARPQTGLNLADIVYEENVENLTRFAAVFHSQLPEPVGPIRSGRTQDINLLGSLMRPIFMWSGGNSKVTQAIRESDLIDASATAAIPYASFFRDNARSAPHNLYASIVKTLPIAGEDTKAPPAQFLYREEDESFAATAIGSSGVNISMDGVDLTWVWNEIAGSYTRFVDREGEVDEKGKPITTENVVVLFVDYEASPADPRSPEAQTVGSGIAWVFTGGKLYVGTWMREDRLDVFSLLDSAGKPIKLTPGRTWVDLPRKDRGIYVEAGKDPLTVDFVG